MRFPRIRYSLAALAIGFVILSGALAWIATQVHHASAQHQALKVLLPYRQALVLRHRFTGTQKDMSDSTIQGEYESTGVTADLFWKVDELGLDGAEMPCAAIAAVSALRGLRTLFVINGEPRTVVHLLEEANGIEELSLGRCDLDDSVVQALHRNPRLHRIALLGVTVSESEMTALCNMQAIQQLELSECTMSSMALEQLHNATHLEVLDVNGIALSISAIARLDNLRILRLRSVSGNCLSPNVAARFRSLKVLQRLEIVDRAIGQLDEMSLPPSIENLVLVGGNVPSRCFDAVIELTRLRTLTIEAGVLPEADLQRLRYVSGLRELVLVNDSLSRDGIARLKDALPKCTIVRRQYDAF